jgi:FAD/FMN-containing dehydrogenase
VAVPADSLQSALDTLTSVTQSGAVLLAAEYCDERTNRRVLAHSGLPTLFATQPPVVLFLEVVGRDLTWQPDDAAKVAQDAASQRPLWAYREQASDSWTAAGDVRKLDVSLPLSRLADFHSELVGLLEGEPAVIEHGSFGHLADGNLHIEVLGLEHTDVAIDGKVLALVASYGGSISAEHGIGRAKSPFLHLAHDAATLNLMRSVRHVFDPRGVLNPGVIFPATD